MEHQPERALIQLISISYGGLLLPRRNGVSARKGIDTITVT